MHVCICPIALLLRERPLRLYFLATEVLWCVCVCVYICVYVHPTALLLREKPLYLCISWQLRHCIRACMHVYICIAFMRSCVRVFTWYTYTHTHKIKQELHRRIPCSPTYMHSRTFHGIRTYAARAHFGATHTYKHTHMQTYLNTYIHQAMSHGHISWQARRTYIHIHINTHIVQAHFVAGQIFFSVSVDNLSVCIGQSVCMTLCMYGRIFSKYWQPQCVFFQSLKVVCVYVYVHIHTYNLRSQCVIFQSYVWEMLFSVSIDNVSATLMYERCSSQ
jgi:hypothetical protein